VRAVYSKTGRFVGFQDPDQGGRFISRAEATERLRYNTSIGRIVDSFDHAVGVANIALPGRGVDVAFQVRLAEYRPLGVSPAQFTPQANQELIERTFFITKEGRIVTSETSYGLGNKYNANKYGGRWRAQASRALGLPEGERLPTTDLRRAVAGKEFIVKTIR